MFCPRLSKIYPVRFYFFENALKKVNFLHKYCPATIGIAFSSNFVLGDKVIFYLFITLFNVGTLKQLIANKKQPLYNSKENKIVIITKMNAYNYTVIFMFSCLAY